MNAWLVISLVLLAAMAAPLAMAATGPLRRRLVAVQLIGAIGLWALVAMSFALNASSAIDLALMLGLLTLPATLLFAVFAERWL